MERTKSGVVAKVAGLCGFDFGNCVGYVGFGNQRFLQKDFASESFN